MITVDFNKGGKIREINMDVDVDGIECFGGELTEEQSAKLKEIDTIISGKVGEYRALSRDERLTGRTIVEWYEGLIGKPASISNQVALQYGFSNLLERAGF